MTDQQTLLFSDLHGKSEQLQKLLARHPETFKICLGDVVGSGDSEGCLRELKKRQIPCIQGNHELDMLDRHQLTDDVKDWVKSWPHRLGENDALFIHTWIQRDKGLTFAHIDSIWAAQQVFDTEDYRLVFVGHSHSPGYWELTEERPRWTHAQAGLTLELQPGRRYIIDVGSLGEPKTTEDPKYVLWRTNAVSWEGLG